MIKLIEGDKAKARCAECSELHEWVLKGPNMGLRVFMERDSAEPCGNLRQLVYTSAITELNGEAVQ